MVFDEIIRFEIELWNGVDARLKADCSVPVTHFEPMSVMDRFGPCRVHDIASELRITRRCRQAGRLGAALPEQEMRQFTGTLRRLRAAGHPLGRDDQPAGGPVSGCPAEVG